jgi:hypothetical protein
MLSKILDMFRLKPMVVPQPKPVDIENQEKEEHVKQVMSTPYVCEPPKPIITVEKMDEPKFVHAKVETVEPPVVEEKPKRTRATPAKKERTAKPSAKKASKSTK